MGQPSNEVLAQEEIEDLQDRARGRHGFMSHPDGSEAAEAEYEAGQALALKGAALPSRATASAQQGYSEAHPATPKEEVADHQLKTGAVQPGHIRPHASDPARKIVASSDPAKGPTPETIGKIENTSNADPRLTKPVAQMSDEEKKATAGAIPDAGKVVGPHAEPGTSGTTHYARTSDPTHHAVGAQHGLGFEAGTASPTHGVTHIQPPVGENGEHTPPGSTIPVTAASKVNEMPDKAEVRRDYAGTQHVIATAHGDAHTATGARLKTDDEIPDSVPGSDRLQQEAHPETKAHPFTPTGEQKADESSH